MIISAGRFQFGLTTLVIMVLFSGGFIGANFRWAQECSSPSFAGTKIGVPFSIWIGGDEVQVTDGGGKTRYKNFRREEWLPWGILGNIGVLLVLNVGVLLLTESLCSKWYQYRKRSGETAPHSEPSPPPDPNDR